MTFEALTYMGINAPLYKKRGLCDIVKFIAALLVVNGHLMIFGNPDSELTPFMNLGACSVSVFFFFSGYGLMTSYAQKGESYLQGFFRRRIFKVLIPFMTAYAVTLPVYALLKGSIDWLMVLETLDWGGPYLKFSWYVTEIVALYCLFYFIMKLKVTMNAKLWLLTIAVVLSMGVMVALHQSSWYVISLPGFIIGIWFWKYEPSLSKLVSNNYFLSLMVVLWFFTWQWQFLGRDILPAYRWEYMSYFVYNACFVLAVIGLIYKIRYTFPISGVIYSSYEIYLMQNCAFIITGSIVSTFELYWIMSMALSVGIGFGMHKLDSRLTRIL